MAYSTFGTLIFLIMWPALLHGVPTGEAVVADPAALAAVADPVASPAISASPVAPAEVPLTNAVPPVIAAPATGGGIVTEHKNPDGSTITVTRYNGPLPADAFRSPLGAGGLSGLHDASSSYLYGSFGAQLLQLQAQEAINQALLRNMQMYSNYNNYYSPPSSYYPFYHRTNPYAYTSAGNYYSPFLPFGFGGYPFYPSYPQQPAKSY